MAIGIHSLADGGHTVLGEELVNAGEGERRLGHPEVVVDDAVQQRSEVLLNGSKLQPDHAATEELGLQANLARRLHDADRIRRVARDVNDLRTGRLDRAHDRRVVRRCRREGLVVDDVQAELLRVGARARGRVEREFVVRGDDRDRLRLGILRHRQVKEALRPVELRIGPRRHDLEVAVVLEFLVRRQSEQRREHQLLAHDDRHRRDDQVGAVARHHQVDLVDIEQLGVDAGDVRPLGRVVVIDELDRPAEQAALFVDVIAPDFHRDQRAFAGAGEAACQRHAEADLDRFRLRHCAGTRQRHKYKRGERSQEQSLEFHRIPPIGCQGHYSKKWS